MYIIGLTGGIATGKSTVAAYLSGLQIPIIDSDQLAHQALLVGREAYLEVVKHFGSAIVNADQTINRRALGKIVFSDEDQRLILERIVHKQVLKDININLAKYRARQVPFVVVDIPLLFEVDWAYLCDEVWVVICDEDQQRQRLHLRDYLSDADIAARIESQMPLAAKIALADVVLDNTGSLANLYQQIEDRLRILMMDEEKYD